MDVVAVAVNGLVIVDGLKLVDLIALTIMVDPLIHMEREASLPVQQ
jgi:L-cystine uptake protein TcyP (sodium:dicarboxylate symporter family)